MTPQEKAQRTMQEYADALGFASPITTNEQDIAKMLSSFDDDPETQKILLDHAIQTEVLARKNQCAIKDVLQESDTTTTA